MCQKIAAGVPDLIAIRSIIRSGMQYQNLSNRLTTAYARLSAIHETVQHINPEGIDGGIYTGTL